MVTHYDMTTGEVIAEQGPGDAAGQDLQTREMAELRLETVREAAAVEARTLRLPADAAMLPVPMLLSRWS